MSQLFKIGPVKTLTNLDQIVRHYAKKRTIICGSSKINGNNKDKQNKNTPKKQINLITTGGPKTKKGLVTSDKNKTAKNSRNKSDPTNPQKVKPSKTYDLIRVPFMKRPNDKIESLYDLLDREEMKEEEMEEEEMEEACSN